jgi:copper chaperone CopZ
MRRSLSVLAASCVGLLLADPARGEDQPVRGRHRITGLFSPDRVADLRETFERLPDIKLVDLDYETAEATLEYVPAKAFPGTKPDEIVKRLDERLRTASSHTFGVLPLSGVPREKLKRVEISVVGLDCKGCSLAAYEAVYKLDGVERATVSFKEGRVTALVDPDRADRARLEEALKKKGVRLGPAPR